MWSKLNVQVSFTFHLGLSLLLVSVFFLFDSTMPHTRGFSIMRPCIGYPELYHRKSPMGIDLLPLEQPDEYKLCTWALSDKEILEELPKLDDTAIFLYHRGNFGGAADAYRKALDSLDQIWLKERPHTTKWKILQEMKVPLQLNYAQCKFCLREYDEVVTLTTSVLEFDRDNAEALFQRADAHLSMYNLVQARRDYERVIMQKSTLAETAESQLTELKKAVQAFVEDEKRKLVEEERSRRLMRQLYH